MDIHSLPAEALIFRGNVVRNTLLILLLIGLYPQTGAAQIKDHYTLVNTGVMFIDIADTDPMMSLGFVYGFGLTPEVSMEMQLDMGVLGGDFNAQGAQGETKLWAFRFNPVYRHPVAPNLYFKLKAGLLYEHLERELGVQGDTESTRWNPSVGAGLGVLYGKDLTLEYEFSRFEDDIYQLSVGINFRF